MSTHCARLGAPCLGVAKQNRFSVHNILWAAPFTFKCFSDQHNANDAIKKRSQHVLKRIFFTRKLAPTLVSNETPIIAQFFVTIMFPGICDFENAIATYIAIEAIVIDTLWGNTVLHLSSMRHDCNVAT